LKSLLHFEKYNITKAKLSLLNKNFDPYAFFDLLEDNDVMDWAPDVPTLLIYCTGDDQVNYMNTLVAVEAFNILGSNSVDYADMGMYNHSVCAPFAMFEALNFFSQHLEPAFEPEMEVNIIHPTIENGGNDGVISVEITSPGNWDFEWSNGADQLLNENLSEGDYSLTIISEQGCRMNYDFELELSTDILSLADLRWSIYPNPTDNYIHITNADPINLQIFNGIGTLVLSERVNPYASLDLIHLSPGIYVVWINNSITEKISVN
jgi:hypothetical protein